MKKVYFIGIAGKTMAALAKAFKDMGWEVLGSDQEEVYPPVTEFLSQNNIAYFKGYKEENLPPDLDLVIVGRSPLLINKENPEYKKAVSLKLNVLSYPEVLNNFLIKGNSIVVAGTYAKSTTTALISWILLNAGLNPSYMFGGVPINFSDGTKISESNYSVVEGDETPALKDTDPPKFMFYKPKYLLLTATEFDHPEVFKTKKSYLETYVDLVKLLPGDGILFYDPATVDEIVIDACKCTKVSFNTTDTALLPDVLFKESAVRAKILCLKLNIDEKIIDSSILSFKGLKERNELLGKFSGRYLFKDLSQQSSKIRSVLVLLREQYPQNKIIVVFNPSSTSFKYKENLHQYFGSFDLADHVIVAKVDYISSVSKEDRVTGPDLVEAFGGKEKVFYEPITKNITKWLLYNSQPEDVIIFMSSGGLLFTELIERVKEELGELGKFEKLGKIGEKARKNVPLADYTTFKIGGPADLFYEVNSEEELVRVVREVRDIGIPYFILGGGSNVLIGDKGYRGIVIKIQSAKCKVQSYNSKFKVLVDAGVNMNVLLNECLNNSLTGLEFMAGIPGTVGGAVRGNAGAWQQSIGDKIKRVKILSEEGEIKWIEQKDCSFLYRDSRFKDSKEIILAVEFVMDKGGKKQIKEQMKIYLDKRLCQPKEPSAGCVFVNPKPDSAGELIEKCNLKGTQIGGAMISEKHANFIVNTGNTKASDVVALINLAKGKVKEKFNIDLQEEIVKIGEF